METNYNMSERLDPDLIASRLISEFGYSSSSAEVTARDLIDCSPVIWEGFLHWWRTDELGQIEIEGFSAAKLVRDHSLYPPGAFLMLDWLLREPRAAKDALARGFDSVRRKPSRLR